MRSCRQLITRRHRLVLVIQPRVCLTSLSYKIQSCLDWMYGTFGEVIECGLILAHSTGCEAKIRADLWLVRKVDESVETTFCGPAHMCRPCFGGRPRNCGGGN